VILPKKGEGRKVLPRERNKREAKLIFGDEQQMPWLGKKPGKNFAQAKWRGKPCFRLEWSENDRNSIGNI